VNKKYDFNYSDRNLTVFEKRLFNSDDKIDLSTYDLNNIEILNSLSIYYHIQMHKIGNNFIENERIFLMLLLKLNKLRDSRGYLRLNSYYFKIKNYEKAIEFAKIGVANNYPLSMINLYVYQLLANPESDRDLSLLIKALEMKEYLAIDAISLHYLHSGDIIEGFKYLEYGLYKKSSLCLDTLQKILSDNTNLYICLTRLPFNNELIEDKLREISQLLDQKRIDITRDKTYFTCFNNQIVFLGTSIELINRYG